MIRQIASLALRPSADKGALLRPLKPQRNLASEVVKRIADAIRSGWLGPGARLPTEQELMAAMRTAIAEGRFAAWTAETKARLGGGGC